MKTVILLLLSLNCYAQFKIGTLEISESVFREYIVDCYKNGDTVDLNQGDRFSHNVTAIDRSIDRQEILKFGTPIMIWNKELRDSLFEHPLTYIMFPRNWEAEKNQRGKLVKIVITKEHTYQYNSYRYTMPRKPSEQDFIRWFNNAD